MARRSRADMAAGVDLYAVALIGAGGLILAGVIVWVLRGRRNRSGPPRPPRARPPAAGTDQWFLERVDGQPWPLLPTHLRLVPPPPVPAFHHGTHKLLALCTFGLWAVTGWPIAWLIWRHRHRRSPR